MKPILLQHGFLPEQDPAKSFPADSELAVLDEIGRDLPSLLQDAGFRSFARNLRIPSWPADVGLHDDLPLLRLYYVRVGFLASAYINQVGQPPVEELPRNLAEPLCHVCGLLGRPPILSYDGYALYNWKRFQPDGPIALGNIDTLQNFVHLYDEHWFILVHVEIEALAAEILSAIARAATGLATQNAEVLNECLTTITQTVWRQVRVLRRIPEKMDPALYYKTFRPYIRFFENVVYENIATSGLSFRGETGAQSSVIPALVAILKIPHQRTALTDHLADMRRFMPPAHVAALQEIEKLPPVRGLVDKELFNGTLDAVATFREVHYGWAQEYIATRVTDPRGTGGTPYIVWLKQLIQETQDYKIA